MKKTSKTIVFFGSGPVAARSLELLAKDFSIEAVVTKPKPPHHRGDFPVIAVAEKLGLPVYTVTNKSDLSKLIGTQKSRLLSTSPGTLYGASRPWRLPDDPGDAKSKRDSSGKVFSSQLGVLIDFGIIVGQDVIDYFPLGIVNSHFSILPQWRGADPITFAILSGQKQTGVSLMFLVEAMDEGPLLGYGEYDMPDDITAPQLTDSLIKLSHALLKHDIPRVFSGEAKSAPQSITNKEVSYSRKLTKQDGIIDWAKPAEQIECEIRAFIEWPKSRAVLGGKEVIITKAHAVPVNHPPAKAGEVEAVEGMLMIECGQSTLCIERLKPAGKNEMSAEAFMQGYRA